MPVTKVRTPSGEIVQVQHPEGATDEQIIAYAKQNATAKPETPQRPVSAMDVVRDFGRDIPDAIAGYLRGAGSVGATLRASPKELGALIRGEANPNGQMRQDMTDALQMLGANPDSPVFKGFKFGGEMSGVAGFGPAIGGFAKAAGAAPAVVNALSSAGMTTGTARSTLGQKAADLALRTGASGVVGAGSAGLIDPEQAKMGAVFGAALPPALKVAKATGQAVGSVVGGAAKHALGLSTGVGSESVSQAFKAGRSGNKDFLANMRGDVPMTDIVDRARAGLAEMAAQRAEQYRLGMIPIKNDKTVLSLAGIDKALKEADAMVTFKGQVKNDAAANAVQRMRAAVDEWRRLDPSEFHTPEGFDALKQKLGGILEGIKFEEKAARLAAGKVYNAAKAEIAEQAPTYAKVMKDYSDATELIAEIERALSLNKAAAADTAMRKLQSLMRNNVQTNYGNRLSLAKALETQGGVDILPAVAGQAMNSWTPRSLVGQAGAGAVGLSAFGNPWLAAALPFQSPRLVGSAAYGLGKASAAGGDAMQPVVKLGANGMPALGYENPIQLLYRSAPVLAADR